MAHRDPKARQAHRDQQVNLGQLVWLDLKVLQGHKEYKVQREMVDRMEVLVHREVLEHQDHKELLAEK